MHQGISDSRPAEHGIARARIHASQMYGSNVASFLKLMVNKGELNINRDDEIIRETLVTHDGKVVNPRVSELLGLADAAPAGERR